MEMDGLRARCMEQDRVDGGYGPPEVVCVEGHGDVHECGGGADVIGESSWG